MGYHYVPVPPDLADAFRARGIRRVIAIVNGVAVRRALLRSGDGVDHVILGVQIMRDVGARPGEPVVVELGDDPEPERIDLGDEFEAVLQQDDRAAERFFAMTPGRQRSLAYYVTSAKRPDTRVRRALELAARLRNRTLYGDP